MNDTDVYRRVRIQFDKDMSPRIQQHPRTQGTACLRRGAGGRHRGDHAE